MQTIHGKCLCGELRFHYETPSLWCAHCHCTLCQRAHGAAFVTWIGVAEDRFSFESDHSLEWYMSSPDSRRGFCRFCGGTMFFQSERWPGEIHVVRTCLTDQVDLEPQLHSCWEGHAAWFPFEDGLPKQEG